MTRPGMRSCGIEKGEPCEEFPRDRVFRVTDEEDPDVNKICCYPATRPGKSRGIVANDLVANNQVDVNGNCP